MVDMSDTQEPFVRRIGTCAGHSVKARPGGPSVVSVTNCEAVLEVPAVAASGRKPEQGRRAPLLVARIHTI